MFREPLTRERPLGYERCRVSNLVSEEIQNVDPVLSYCWAIVVDGGPTLYQHEVFILDKRYTNMKEFNAMPVMADINTQYLFKSY